MSLVMQAPGRIYYQNVSFSGGSRYKRIKQNGGRVGSLLLLDYLHPGTLRPYLELVTRGGAKSIRSTDQHLVSLVFNTLGELADGGCFPNAVYADDHQHVWFYRFVNAAFVRHAAFFGMMKNRQQLTLHRAFQRFKI